MRFLAATGATLLAATALSDRLITIPIGRKLPTFETRFEFQSESGHARFTRYYFAAGLTKTIDAEFRLDKIVGDPALGTLDLSYNFQPPITDLSPGLSVGVLDALNRSERGREFYGAITFRQGLQVEALNLYADATIGARIGRHQYPFLGVSLPFSDYVRLLIEHDGYDLRGGFELRPIKPLGIRAVFEQGRTTLSLQIQHRFRS